jgi:hypothetical protein
MHVTRYDLADKAGGPIYDDIKFFIGHFIPTAQRNSKELPIIDKSSLMADHID